MFMNGGTLLALYFRSDMDCKSFTWKFSVGRSWRCRCCCCSSTPPISMLNSYHFLLVRRINLFEKSPPFLLIPLQFIQETALYAFHCEIHRYFNVPILFNSNYYSHSVGLWVYLQHVTQIKMALRVQLILLCKFTICPRVKINYFKNILRSGLQATYHLPNKVPICMILYANRYFIWQNYPSRVILA